jgi:hypothetical protein
MTAAVVTSAASSNRLLADLEVFVERDAGPSEPALARLEAVIGRDLADRLVSALAGSDRR